MVARLAPPPLIVAVGLFGAALIYGDGAITPAISVLSALEGLNIIEPALEPYVLPLTVAVLVALFALQPLGTARIGRAFGPVMLLWFVTMAVLGAWGVSRHPGVLAANPGYGVDYLFHSGGAGFVVLGGVFLCVTGAEALPMSPNTTPSAPTAIRSSGGCLLAVCTGTAFPRAIPSHNSKVRRRMAALRR
jgi:K+ transporter